MAKPPRIRVIYRWKVPEDRIEEFVATWRGVTTSIHARTEGAMGSFCQRNLDDPGEVLTVALWQSEAQWREFIKTAKSTSMRALHEIGEQVSATPYEELGDETVYEER